MLLAKGQKINITKGTTYTNLDLQFGWNTTRSDMSIDAACFILSEKNQCERDEDFIFYGNPSTRNGAVSHQQVSGMDKEALQISLSRLADNEVKLALTVTIHEGEKHGYSMRDITDLYVRLIDRDSGIEIGRYDYGSDLTMETAIVVGELYRHQKEWKFNAIGSGFNGGLAALCSNYGLVVEHEAESEVAAAKELPNISSIDLRKKIVTFTLEKKKIPQITARVGLVLDITGSMQSLYKNGTVQQVVERILAVAVQFDDNAQLDLWVYDNEFSRLPPASEQDIEKYVVNHIINNRHIHKFGRNYEPPVMYDVIHKYTVEERSDIPVFLIFINDGGVVKPIKKVIIESAVQPIFWQFVGIGQSDFEVLRRLDTMEGRVVDNANFIHIEDISLISDEMLYDQLLDEFPVWLIAANEKGIIIR